MELLDFGSPCAAGSATHCWVLRQYAFACSASGDRDHLDLKPLSFAGVGLVGYRWLSGVVFENCTVDASIFVVKLLRAYGECLGIRSR